MTAQDVVTAFTEGFRVGPSLSPAQDIAVHAAFGVRWLSNQLGRDAEALLCLYACEQTTGRVLRMGPCSERLKTLVHRGAPLVPGYQDVLAVNFKRDSVMFAVVSMEDNDVVVVACPVVVVDWMHEHLRWSKEKFPRQLISRLARVCPEVNGRHDFLASPTWLALLAATQPAPRQRELRCEVCGTQPAKHCKACLQAAYCGPECQRKAWKGGHRDECVLLGSMMFLTLQREDERPPTEFYTPRSRS
jgi:hypothetical protein